MNRFLFILFFFLCMGFSFAQEDTTKARGTIKISKPKVISSQVYIMAEAQFGNVDNTGRRLIPFSDGIFLPFPIVDGHAYPFNYTGYYTERFKGKKIKLEGRDADTVTIEVKILSNGKVYLKDRSPLLMVNGVPAFYNEKVGGYELNNLHLNCLDYTKDMREWIPAYYVQPQKAKFKKTTVIKPNKKNVDATGIIKIYFSTSPFDY